MSLVVVSVVLHRNKQAIDPTDPTANPQFIIAGWDYPYEYPNYGEGISTLTIYDNETGTWDANVTLQNENSSIIFWDVGMPMKIRAYCYLNSSPLSLSDIADGHDYFRLSVTVTNIDTLTVVFSASNFTYSGYSYDTYDPIWLYLYDVVLDFTPQYSQSYRIAISYEVMTNIHTVYSTVSDDADDTNWEGSSNENTRTSDYVAAYGGNLREYWFRITVPVPYDMDICSATANFYATIIDTGDEAITLQRSTEIDLGSMEADTSKPEVTSDNESVGAWPSGTGWFTVDCVDTIQTIINNSTWTNNSYIGFRLYDSGGSDDGNALEDYQHADSHHTYLNITYGRFGVVTSINLCLNVLQANPYHVWFWNIGLIIAGLVMLPLSTVLLAYHVKHRSDGDDTAGKFAMALIMFLFGLSLLIATIAP